MPSVSEIIYYLVHPVQLRAIIQWKVWHQPVHEREPEKETPTLKQCYFYLDLTSRSFSAVIKELHPELLVPVCLFYLVLRGLDTIEDDMTIPLSTKEPILRSFDEILEKDGWTFDGNHSKEKDRDLLVHFYCVITEFAKIKEPYKVIIKDVAKRMGEGMADYCKRVEHNEDAVNTIAEYEQYCHYVAGLVGEGLTRLFVEAKLANPALLERPELMESMGQFLQQVNIIRDVKEDWDENRCFWPKEIWSKYVDSFEDLLKVENKDAALNCNSEMIYTALTRADDCLYYLAGLREQSIFNFCAIPQTMAIATMDLCFRNHQMFKRNIKITKGDACQVMLDSTGNLQMVCDVFKRYARSIHKKSIPQDPNYLNISIACGRIEQFIETIFPSQKSGRPAGTKSPEEIERERQKSKGETWEIFFVGLAVIAAMLVCTITMLFVAWLFGARFDLVFEEIRKGQLLPVGGSSRAEEIVKNLGHQEL